MSANRSLANEIVSLIEDKLGSLEWEIDNIRREHRDAIARAEKRLELTEWIELPDYPLMQHQKDAINRAIEMVLNGELEGM